MVAGDMEVGDSIGRKRLEKLVRGITMIDAIDVNIVHVEQQIAIRSLKYGREEFDLVDLLPERGIVGNVFDRNSPFQHILHLTNSPRSVGGCFLRERHRQEIIEMPIVPAKAQMFAINQMFAIKKHPVLIEKLLQGVEEIKIKG